MSNLIVANTSISQHNGFFSLNDLHRASGAEKKHQPALFFRNAEVQELISEIERSTNLQNGEKAVAYHTIQGGNTKTTKQGTYACRELVYRYAMWISPKFSLMVIRAFDALNTGAIPALAESKINDTQAYHIQKTTAHDRTPLVQACARLSVGYMSISDVYKLVGAQFGCTDIASIPAHSLPEAVAFTYELILAKNHHKPMLNALLKDCADHLTDYIHLMKSLKQFPLLDEQIARHRHDHAVLTYHQLIALK